MAKESSKPSAEQVDLLVEPQVDSPAERISAEDEDDISASQEALAEAGQRVSTDEMRRELGL